MMSTQSKFRVFKSAANDQHYYRLSAHNGEPILSGEGYTSKRECLEGIASVKKNASLDGKFIRKTASDGQYYFDLLAGNGEIIGVSELYETIASRENGVKAVQEVAPNAPIEDLSA